MLSEFPFTFLRISPRKNIPYFSASSPKTRGPDFQTCLCLKHLGVPTDERIKCELLTVLQHFTCVPFLISFSPFTHQAAATLATVMSLGHAKPSPTPDFELPQPHCLGSLFSRFRSHFKYHLSRENFLLLYHYRSNAPMFSPSSPISFIEFIETIQESSLFI